MALSASMVGQGGWPSRSDREPLGDGPLGLPQLPHEDALALLDGVGDHHAVAEFEVDRVLQDLGRDLQQFLGQLQQLVAGQAAVTVIDRVQQGVGDPGSGPIIVASGMPSFGDQRRRS